MLVAAVVNSCLWFVAVRRLLSVVCYLPLVMIAAVYLLMVVVDCGWLSLIVVGCLLCGDACWSLLVVVVWCLVALGP